MFSIFFIHVQYRMTNSAVWEAYLFISEIKFDLRFLKLKDKNSVLS